MSIFKIVKIFAFVFFIVLFFTASYSQAQTAKVKTVYKDKMLAVTADEPVKIKRVFAPVLNGDLQLISEFYQIDSPVADFEISFYYNKPSEYSRSIYSYDKDLDQWQLLPSYHDFVNKIITANITDQIKPLIIGIFEDQTAHDGIASFYDQSRYKVFGRKNGDFAASRHYPKGTKLRVTRLLTGRSVDVTVNDYGPEESTGRLIDLDVSAFQKIGSKRAGIIYVKVEEL